MTYDGIVHDLDERTYHAQPELSSTGAKHLVKSGAHFQHYITQPHEDKAEFDLGTAVHSKVLGVGAQIAVYPDGDGPETFEFEDKVYDDVLAVNGAISTKAAKAFADSARRGGLIPVKRVVARVVDRMAESVLSDHTARALLEHGSPEVSIFGTDPATGVRCRGRFDWLGRRAVDLKTTSGEASEVGFAKHAFDFGYHIQFGHYEYLHEIITGDEIPYVFIVVETDAPYLTGVHTLGADEQTMGRDWARLARERFAEYSASGEWPGYRTRSGGPIGILRAPQYAIYDYIDQFQGAAA